MKTTIRDIFSLAKLFLKPAKNRASTVYDLISTRNNLGEKSLYLNLGYWDGARTYDEACQRLAEILGEAAGLGNDDRVLDCGFGFGDQDMYWARRFGVGKIDGINITASQVEVARRRVQENGLKQRVELRHGSATAIPFEPSTFTKVLALETAFHYDTREKFFHEAFRVLIPGGRLSTADIIPTEGPISLFNRLGQYLGRSFWQIPTVNQYPVSEYRRKLEAAGFANIKVRSIAAQVYRPFAEFAEKRLADPAVRSKMNPLIRLMWIASLDPMSRAGGIDYVIVTADKPRTG